jgi:hypothetical protein
MSRQTFEDHVCGALQAEDRHHARFPIFEILFGYFWYWAIDPAPVVCSLKLIAEEFLRLSA